MIADKYCVKCFAANEKNARICCECGWKEFVIVPDGTKYCLACSTKNPIGQKVCISCKKDLFVFTKEEYDKEVERKEWARMADEYVKERERIKEEERKEKERIAAEERVRQEAEKKEREHIAEIEAAKKKKGWTVGIIATILAIIVAIVSVSFVDCKVRDGCEFTLADDGQYYIVSGWNGLDQDVVIPSEYKGLPVKEIGAEAFGNGDTLLSVKTVVIPDSITKIGYKAFNGRSLTSVKFGNSVQIIGNFAFNECYQLEKIELPDSVTELGDGAFANCEKANSLTLSKNLTSIDDGAFYNCVNIRHKIVVPAGVTYIGVQAFSYCGLTEIVIPTSVTKLGGKVFMYASNLKNISYQGTVKEWKANVKIGNYWDYGMGTDTVVCVDGSVSY